MPIIAIINQKGGCGKTITAVNLSASLAANRKKILLIDMDPQGHASLSFGVEPEKRATVFDLLDFDADKQFRDVIIELTPELHLAPANIALSVLEQKLAGKHGRENRLRDKLARVVKDYDSIIIDCPPNLGLLTINALIACQRVIVPVDASVFSLHGLEKLLETMAMLKNKLGHEPEVFGLATIFDGRTNFAKAFLTKLQEIFGTNLYKTIIPSSIKFREAAEEGLPLLGHAPSCKGAQAYLDLAVEILKRDRQQVAKAVTTGQWRPAEARSPKQITFVFPEDYDARLVQIAGEFNNWDPAAGTLEKGEDGSWLTTMPLKPGNYQYKYLVDGEWMLDPVNQNKTKTDLGSVNSVITVN